MINLWVKTYRKVWKVRLLTTLTDFKVAGDQAGTGEQTREDHVNGYWNIPTDISFTDLYILDFGGFLSETVAGATRFHAAELQFDRFDGDVASLHRQLQEREKSQS